MAASRLDLAALLLDEGHPRDAADRARDTIEAFRSAGDVESEAIAQLIVARGELAEGKTNEAKSAIDQAVKLLPRVETRSRALMIRITAAQVQGRAGYARESLKSLSSALAEARRLGLVGVALEARLALGEMELAAGQR